MVLEGETLMGEHQVSHKRFSLCLAVPEVTPSVVQRMGGLCRSAFYTRHGKRIPLLHSGDGIANANVETGFRLIHLTWALGTFAKFTAPMHAVTPSAPPVVISFQSPASIEIL